MYLFYPDISFCGKVLSFALFSFKYIHGSPHPLCVTLVKPEANNQLTLLATERRPFFLSSHYICSLVQSRPFYTTSLISPQQLRTYSRPILRYKRAHSPFGLRVGPTSINLSERTAGIPVLLWFMNWGILFSILNLHLLCQVSPG